jgi:RimJ/RimL family protein N-acetyltransferase
MDLLSVTTFRLSIEPLAISDAAFTFELLNTEGWLRFIGNRNIATIEDAEAYIKKILANKDIRYWVAKLKDSNESLGLVTFIKRDYLDHPDIGFAFLPQFSKNGYAHEATAAVLQRLVEDASLSYILATTIPENVKSIRLLTKLGLVFEKEIQTEKDKLHVYGAAADKLRQLLI